MDLDEQATRDRLLSPTELASYLGVPVNTLYGWRTRGLGPRGSSVGRHVRYPLSEVTRWLNEQAQPRVTTRSLTVPASRSRSRTRSPRRQ